MCIYITSDNGLCNRLSILCAHSVYQGRGCKLGRGDCRVYVRWNVNNHCNGRFEEIFEGIDNVSLAKYILDKTEGYQITVKEREGYKFSDIEWVKVEHSDTSQLVFVNRTNTCFF